MHILAVRNGAPNTMTIASMPYGSYATEENAVENAVRMMKESGATLKLQLGKEGTSIIKQSLMQSSHNEPRRTSTS